jgi:preprotein translocase subunit SecG
MLSLIIVLIAITCVLLGLVVLVQNSKGGGLASNFASSNQIMGVKKTTDFIEKATWTLAIVVMVLSLTSSFMSKREYAKLYKSGYDTEVEAPMADQE